MPNFLFLIAILLTMVVSSCNQESSKTTQSSDGVYGILVLSDETEKEYFLETGSLTEGSLQIPEKAKAISSLIIAYRDGFYYGLDDDHRYLTRYKPGDAGLIADQKCRFDTIPWKYFSSWHNWVDDHTLLIGSTMEGRQFVYSLVDVRTMRILTHGNFDIPIPAKPEYYGGIVAQLRDNQIFIAYTLYEGFGSPVPARDTTYMAVIDYPSMKTLDMQKDTRSTWPGGYFLHAPFSVIDEGDIYFLAQPGGRTHNHPTAPTGIYRIKKGEQRLDSTYFFTLADKQKQEGYLLYDLGQGKALIKMVDKSRINQYMDYLNKRVADYYVLNLKTQTKTKLALPLDRLDFVQNVLVDGDRVYIAVNTGENESHIWQYDPASGELTKGLKIPGRVYQLNRLR